MSLRLKTILGIGLIEAILLVILISTVLNYMREVAYDDMESYVETTTTLFSSATQDAILSQDLASLDTFIEEILKNHAVIYARIKDSDNFVLSEGGDQGLLKSQRSVDTSITMVDDDIYDAIQAVIIDDEVYGEVNIGFSTQNIEVAIKDTREMAATIAAIEMLLVAIFSFALGLYLTKQLSVLRRFANKVSEGDLSQEIRVNSKDEIAEVSNAFNLMIRNLKKSKEETEKYQSELEQLNNELEHRVAKRTQLIINKNKELESANEKIKAAQEQLIQSEKMASIGQLAAGVAHEINNPVAFVQGNLSSLKNYISTLQNLIKKQEEIIHSHQTSITEKSPNIMADLKEFIEEEDIEFLQEDIVTLVSESIEGTSRVSEIVKGLKTYSRESTEDYSPIQVNDCLKDTLRMLNNEIKYTCTVKTKFGDIPEINGNAGKLNQVFTNLIVNASQAVEKDGEIKILTGKKDDQIIVQVKDNGKGIKDEDMRNIFDPFFTTKAVGEGTGLGLSISAGIIEDHGGHIDVTSKLNVGTCFTLHLPLSH